MTNIRVLLAGESWVSNTTHVKGWDFFSSTSYDTGIYYLQSALTSAGINFTHLPNHLADVQFPTTLEQLAEYDVVVLSDIGANTLLLHPDTFDRSIPRPDRLAAIEAYVAGGGGLVMIGGYLTFQGIDGKARWSGTPVERALPVTIGATDDRVESPAGVEPVVRAPDHPIAAGLPDTWPALLGYNRVVPRPGADVVVTVGEDPLIVAGTHGRGRGVAFTSDCGPHWCPPPFLAWDGYARIWRQLVGWVAGA